MSVPDPLEEQIAEALKFAGLRFFRETDRVHFTHGLDFYICDLDVYVEVKRAHADRIANQTARVPNIIVLQGAKSVDLFCALIKTDLGRLREIAAE